MVITIDVLGAGREIGRSCLIVTWHCCGDANACSSIECISIMLDCGIHLSAAQKYPDFTRWCNNTSATLSQRIRCVLITHFHLDHVGALPHLLKTYTGPVYMTAPTKAFAELLLTDQAARPQSNDEFHVRAEDIRSVFNDPARISILALGERVNLGPIAIQAFCAGHVAGASMFAITVFGKTCVYTGDLNTNADVLIGEADNLPCLRPEVLITEGTYATVQKDSRPSVDRDLVQAVANTLKSNGKVLIPCLSAGKAQEIAAVLGSALPAVGVKEDVPIYIGGFMGMKSTELYLTYPDFGKSCDLPKRVWKKTAPLKLDSSVYVQQLEDGCGVSEDSSEDSSEKEEVSCIDSHDQMIEVLKHQALVNNGSYNSIQGSAQAAIRQVLQKIRIFDDAAERWADETNSEGVVFASASMLTGGLALKLFKRWADNPNNLVIFTGKCVAGTVGEKVSHGSKSVVIPDGSVVNVACGVRYFPYANHAGHLGLRRFIESVDSASCVLVHGDAPGLVTLRNLLRAESGIDAYAPKNFEQVLIDGTKRAVQTVRANAGAKKARTLECLELESTGTACNLARHVRSPTVCIKGDDNDLYPLVGGTQFLQRNYLRQLLTDPPIGPDCMVECIPIVNGTTSAEDAEDGELSDEEEGAAHEDSMVKLKDRFRQFLLTSPSETAEPRHVSVIRCNAWINLSVWQESVELFAKDEDNAALLGACYFEKSGYRILAVMRYQLVLAVGANANTRQALCQWWNDETSVQEIYTKSNASVRMQEDHPGLSDASDFLAPLIITCDIQQLKSMQQCNVDSFLTFWKLVMKSAIEHKREDTIPDLSAPATIPEPLFTLPYSTGITDSTGFQNSAVSPSPSSTRKKPAAYASKSLSGPQQCPPPMPMPPLPDMIPPSMKFPTVPSNGKRGKSDARFSQRSLRAAEYTAVTGRVSGEETYINREFNSSFGSLGATTIPIPSSRLPLPPPPPPPHQQPAINASTRHQGTFNAIPISHSRVPPPTNHRVDMSWGEVTSQMPPPPFQSAAGFTYPRMPELQSQAQAAPFSGSTASSNFARIVPERTWGAPIGVMRSPPIPPSHSQPNLSAVMEVSVPPRPPPNQYAPGVQSTMPCPIGKAKRNPPTERHWGAIPSEPIPIPSSVSLAPPPRPPSLQQPGLSRPLWNEEEALDDDWLPQRGKEKHDTGEEWNTWETALGTQR